MQQIAGSCQWLRIWGDLCFRCTLHGFPTSEVSWVGHCWWGNSVYWAFSYAVLQRLIVFYDAKHHCKRRRLFGIWCLGNDCTLVNGRSLCTTKEYRMPHASASVNTVASLVTYLQSTRAIAFRLPMPSSTFILCAYRSHAVTYLRTMRHARACTLTGMKQCNSSHFP